MDQRILGVLLFVAALAACEGTGVRQLVGDIPDAADVGSSEGVTDASSAQDLQDEPDVGEAADMSTSDAATIDMMPDTPSTSSSGCIDGAGLAEGVHTFVLEERDRRYILRLPNGYTNERSWPLVFALHGNGGSAAYWDVDTPDHDRNIRAVLQDDAILVIAEAIEGNWRDYDAPQEMWPARIESELLYFDHIVEEARGELCIDTSEIFSMGFSGGGSFSGVLACRRDDIRAIAVGGSVVYFDESKCVGTSAAWITIGTEELTPGREVYRDWFRDRAGCAETTTDTTPAPCVGYDGCGEGTPVHYCQHPDGHIWPSFGAGAMWQFFSQFVD